MTMMGSESAAAGLRAALAEGMVVAPFIYDGITARIAAQEGAKAVYMTGHGTSAQLGLPDMGLTSMAEMVANVGYISNAVSVPVIADADNGYGNAANVQRAVREYITAGAAALHIEDQVFPKRCGFFEGKEVIAMGEHVQKVKAAIDARADNDLIIIARTDALAPKGWDEAVRRAEAYHEAGADMVFVDGIKTEADLDTYAERLASRDIPCVYNGQLTTTHEVSDRGFKLMITGGGHGLSYAAVRQALVQLKQDGAGAGQRNEARFQALTSLLGLPEVYELEQKYSDAPK